MSISFTPKDSYVGYAQFSIRPYFFRCFIYKGGVSNLFCWYTIVDTALAQNILGNLALDNILRTHSIMVRFLTLRYVVLFGGIRNGCLVHYATI